MRDLYDKGILRHDFILVSGNFIYLDNSVATI